MESSRERWIRVMIAAGAFLLAVSLYFAYTVRRGEGYSLFDLLRGAEPPEPDPLESVTMAQSPADVAQKAPLLILLNEEYARLIETVLPSVVSIEVQRAVNRFYVTPARDGSGFIVSREGHIITNHHVIEKGDEIFVNLHGRKRYKAQVVGSDARADIAVLKISGGVSEEFPALPLADSDTVRVGEMVVAVGNPFGLSESVTRGIISAKERRISDADTSFFQTDALINPGSSGGPLLNLSGEVIGVNVYLLGRAEELNASRGVSLAIPSNDVTAAFREIINVGRPSPGYLGISVEDIDIEAALRLGLKRSSGGVIMEVIRDSPAEQAGLRTDDVVHTFNGKGVENTTELIARVRGEPVGAEVVLGMVRDRKPHTVTVTIGERSTAVPLATAAQKREGLFLGSLSDFLGIEVIDLTEKDKLRAGFPADSPAVLITKVRPGTPAAASLQRGDIVHALNQQPIHSAADFKRMVNAAPLNRTSALLITHKGSRALFLFHPSLSAVRR